MTFLTFHQTVFLHKGFFFSGSSLYPQYIFFGDCEHFKTKYSKSQRTMQKLRKRSNHGNALPRLLMQAAPPRNYRIRSKSFLISGFLRIFEMNCVNCLNMVIAESRLRNNFFQAWGVPFLEKKIISRFQSSVSSA